MSLGQRAATAYIKTASLQKNALLELAASGYLGAEKARKSKHPDEQLQGAIRGAAGWTGGKLLGVLGGGILGATAAALLSGGNPLATDVGTLLGGISGGIYGGVKGYKALTSRYENSDKTASLQKNAWLDIAAAGALGATKAHRSKQHPDEEVEGAVRGAAGYTGGMAIGGFTGGVLGGVAAALLTGGNTAVIPAGAVLGGIPGGIYGGVKGYKALTSRYDD